MASRTEWRVTWDDRHGKRVAEDNFGPHEEGARDWARIQREDYPHHVFTVESREVTPWVAANGASEGEQSG